MNDVFILGAPQDNVGLQNWFANDLFFSEVIEWLGARQLATTVDDASQQWAWWRVEDFLIKDGKLWRVARGKQAWCVPHVECILVQEAHVHTVAAHTNGGHFGRNLMVLGLQQKYF